MICYAAIIGTMRNPVFMDQVVLSSLGPLGSMGMVTQAQILVLAFEKPYPA